MKSFINANMIEKLTNFKVAQNNTIGIIYHLKSCADNKEEVNLHLIQSLEELVKEILYYLAIIKKNATFRKTKTIPKVR